MENKLIVPKRIALFAAIVAIIAFFLPLVSQTEGSREYYMSRSDEKALESLNITFGDMLDISMFEYVRVYFSAEEAELHMSQGAGTFYGCLISSIALLALLIILCAMKSKPVLTLVFDAALAGIFASIVWDFGDRGIAPSSSLEWGIAYNLYYPIAVIIAVCAVWMFIVKRKIKKQKLMEQA